MTLEDASTNELLEELHVRLVQTNGVEMCNAQTILKVRFMLYEEIDRRAMAALNTLTNFANLTRGNQS